MMTLDAESEEMRAAAVRYAALRWPVPVADGRLTASRIAFYRHLIASGRRTDWPDLPAGRRSTDREPI